MNWLTRTARDVEAALVRLKMKAANVRTHACDDEPEPARTKPIKWAAQPHKPRKAKR